MVTILLMAYNQFAQVKLCLESIQMFADVTDYEVVVVDNGSTDGLREWAGSQTGFTYVYMDEGHTSVGKVINEVVKALELTGDLLIMEAHFLLTPEALSRMMRTLYSAEDVGAVGGCSNGFLNHQKFEPAADYCEAVEKAEQQKEPSQKRVLGLAERAVLLKRTMMEQIGEMDEGLEEQTGVMTDYWIRMVLADWKLLVCGDAILWDILKQGRRVLQADAVYLRNKWGMHYLNTTYSENVCMKIDAQQESDAHILEIGCDCGATLLEIKNRYPNVSVYGCEINEHAARVASHVATVTVNNIENEDLPYEEGKFDYIIFGDVLEHLRDPEKVLRYCHTLLGTNGKIIASIPNVMHISVIEELLKGNFTYTEIGLLDKTHIHLFTYNEIVNMFERAGYEVEEVGMTRFVTSAEQAELIRTLCSLRQGVPDWMYTAYQYLVRARKLQES